VRRLFVAVWPPASLTDQLRSVARPQQPGLRWTTEDQWHVTLRFFGPVEDEREADLRARLASAAGRAGGTLASAGPRARPLGRGVWVLPVEGLDALAGSIGDAAAEIGRPPLHRPFRGHITLARARQPSALAGLAAEELGDRWTVSEITLVSSDLRPEGARYQVVGRWPLGGIACGSARLPSR